MLLKASGGMYLTYTSETFPDPRRKKQVFVEQYLGLFLAELGLFCHFVPGLLAISLGSKPPPLIRIAGIGLGSKLVDVVILQQRAGKKITFLRNTNNSQLSPCGHPAITDTRYYAQNSYPHL